LTAIPSGNPGGNGTVARIFTSPNGRSGELAKANEVADCEDDGEGQQSEQGANLESADDELHEILLYVVGS
jgi:hypothetical protein